MLGWDSDSAIDAGLLADIVLGVVSLAFVAAPRPHAFILFMALELAKEGTEAIVAAAVIDENVQDRVDAGVLDVAPNRFTVVRAAGTRSTRPTTSSGCAPARPST